ncbi:TcaA second domain-containing protein [Streptococcus iners]|uniref:Uncharacterized protein n=1 Tax=Streptococcus iners TaxID=3028084 RepID=A0AA96W1U5_9STRE|nr:hypothetical protein [Streptococcus sp. 29887]MCK4025282.1 hypothetical protein [Streptococcus suis]WNY51960.1 hypothetical protein PW252_04765 [Streptococcus sp. 29887]
MATKEKWVELFEKVVGRKPSPEEFIKAKDLDFDIKQIKAIAGLPVEASQELVQETVEQVKEVVVPASEVVDAVVEPAPIPVSQVQTQPPTPQFAQAKPISRKKKIAFGLGAVAVLGLAAGYYYMDKTTGMDVAIEDFSTAIESNDYDRIANLLSTKEAKWSKTEAKSFISYLNDEGVNIETELKAIEASGGKNTYNDQRGNKLLGLQETGKKLGIFSEYQVVSYPLEITVNSNLSDLVINETKIAANKETSLGEFRFANQSLKAKGTTKLGAFETELQPSLKQASENKLNLNLSTVKKQLKLNLPTEVTGATEIKVIANGKEIATGLQSAVEVLENQRLDISVEFKYEGGGYKTETATVLVDPALTELEGELALSSDTSKKIAEAKKAKEEKEAQARAEQALKSNIQSFMSEYIESMRSSINSRTVRFDKYFDTSSQVYHDYVNYIENGGVAGANINYQSTIDYTVTDVRKDGENYLVTVHNQFREVYLNGKSDTVTKNQVFNVKPNGDSFLIFGVNKE